MFKKLALAGALLFVAALAACGGLGKVANPISQTTVFNLENAYGVAQSAAVAYTKLPRCGAGVGISPINVCSQHAVIVKLAGADQVARAALDHAEAFVRQNPTLSAVSLIAEARTAIALFAQIEAMYGVR